MTTDSEPARQATNLEIAQLIETMQASDSVELKMTVVPDQHRATVASLPIDPVEAQPRQVYFFDTPDLRLNQAGVVVRARRIQGGRGDTVVKLRPVVPAELPEELRKSTAFNVEVDVLPGLFGVCSASLKGRISGAEIREAVRGEIPLRKLFTKDQRAFYKEHAPDRSRVRRSAGARANVHPQVRVPGHVEQPPLRRGAVALPGRQPDPRAVDQVPAERGLPGRGRSPGVPRRARHRGRCRHAADEDQDGPRVLQRPPRRHRTSLASNIALDGLGTGDDEEALPSNADDADDDDLPTTAGSDDEDDAGDRR